MEIRLINKVNAAANKPRELTAKERREARLAKIMENSPRLQKYTAWVSEFDSSDENMEKMMYRKVLGQVKNRLTLDADIEKLEGSLAVSE